MGFKNNRHKHSQSLSARRAWIEICRQGIFAQTFGKSLSARRAWIEIIKLGNSAMIGGVALRKESVDRNYLDLVSGELRISRSPQGERG